GMAEDEEAVRWLAEAGVSLLQPEAALDRFDQALDAGRQAPPLLCVADVDWTRFAPLHAAVRPRRLLDRVVALPRNGAVAPANVGVPTAPWLADLAGSKGDDRLRALDTKIGVLVAAVMGRAAWDMPGRDDRLFDLGLDSLMAVELRKKLAAASGQTLPATVVFDHPTTARLAAFLAERMPAREGTPEAAAAGAEPAPAPAPAPTPAPVSVTSSPAPKRALEDENATKDADAIVVVGMACRFPGADSPEAYWDLLQAGRDALSEVPPGRWDMDQWYDPDPETPNRIYCKRAGFIDDIAGFDAGLFSITPREAMGMDPQHRLALEVSWEALERAGLAGDVIRATSTGVFLGITASDYARMMLDDARSAAKAIDPYFVTGTPLNAAAGRIAYALGLDGPSLAVDTACSSALVAVHQAMAALRAGDCSIALAGGVNALLSPEIMAATCQARMLSPQGRCATFDVGADGFVRAEGCGMVVLMRQADADARGVPVLARLVGGAVNQDGQSGGFTVPCGPSQAALIRRALERAGLSPAHIDHVEAHGTGTSLGDPIELGALGSVFGGAAAADRPGPLVVGSVKTNLGHLESAAGVAGLIKVILSLQHGQIPQHLHFKTPTPHADWDSLPVQIPGDGPMAWPRRAERPRIAGVSSFGFSGTNAHILVQEAPEPSEQEQGPEATQPLSQPLPQPLPLLLSAKDPDALRGLAARWADRLATPEAPVANLLATAARGREMFAERLSLSAADGPGLATALQRWLAGTADALTQATSLPATGIGAKGSAARLAWLCTGQGSQYPRMALGLAEAFPAAKVVLDEADALLRAEGGAGSGLYALLQAEDPFVLSATEATQPALYAVECAVAAVLKAHGLAPTVLLGHSVGEYVAAHLAGVVSFADGLRLVAARGRLMADLCPPGAMAALRCSEDTAEALLQSFGAEDIALAGINGAANVSVAGAPDTLDALLAEAKTQGIHATWLAVSRAFHSPLVEPMLAAFGETLAKVTLSPPQTPILSNVTGGDLTAAEATDPAYWVRHIRAPVRFFDGAKALAGRCEAAAELGPRPLLSALLREALEDTPSFRGSVSLLRPGRGDTPPEDRTTAAAGLGALWSLGAAVDWSTASQGIALVDAPTYAFHRTPYWVAGASAPGSMPSGQGGEDLYGVTWEPMPTDAAGSTTYVGDWQVVGGSERQCKAVEAALVDKGATLGADGAVLDLTALSWGDDIDAACDSLAGDLLHRVQAHDGPGPLWLAAAGPIAPMLSGFGLALAAELGPRWGGVIEVESPDAATAATTIVGAALSAGEEELIRLGAEGASVPRLLPVVPLSRNGQKLDRSGTWLITGGLGALGMRSARRLAEQGADSVILVSRRAPSAAALQDIDAIKALGCAVEVASLDLSDADAVAAFCQGRALTGIVHAAGIVTRTDLAEETPAGIQDMLAGKVRGAWALHHATRDNAELKAFVLYGSIAGVWGSKGQSAYGAANRALEALAALRQDQGLPGLCLAWGPWAGGGMAEDEEAVRWLAEAGVSLLQPEIALDRFDQALDAGRHAPPLLCVADVDWTRFAPLHAAARPRRLLDRVADHGAVPDASSGNGSSGDADLPSLRLELEALAPTKRLRRMTEEVRQQTAAVMAVPVADIPATKGFFDLGLDSFLSVDLRGRLGRALGVTLPATAALEHPNPQALARHLVVDRLGLALTGEASLSEGSATGPSAMSGVTAGAAAITGTSTPQNGQKNPEKSSNVIGGTEPSGADGAEMSDEELEAFLDGELDDLLAEG
ncbi:MAG: SDR family NAD(P)-dependent oxidoreductase, partial [Rhodospirillaceae bacterium]